MRIVYIDKYNNDEINIKADEHLPKVLIVHKNTKHSFEIPQNKQIEGIIKLINNSIIDLQKTYKTLKD